MPKKYAKRFLEWIARKQQLETRYSKPPYFNEGELWRCAVGENLGVEVSGKGKKFCRPVIVFKKFGTKAFLGIPTTTNTDRIGDWYVQFRHNSVNEVGMLNQMRVLRYKRLDVLIGTLDYENFIKVKEAHARLFKN